jgi:hypothetical protein
MTTPSVISPKKNEARLAKIKSANTKSKKTLKSAPTDSVIVYISAYNPTFFFAKRTILVTLNTLIILAI